MTKKPIKPKELNPWDRRPWPTSGTKSLSKLYASVGQTLSQWERYEDVLSRIFSALVTDGHTIPSQRAYTAVRTFEGRSEMLKAASAAYFTMWPNDKLQAEFKNILKDAKNYAPRRNEIAHGTVDHFEPWPIIRPHRSGYRPKASYALYPSYANFKDRDITGVPSYCYTSPELDYFYRQFYNLMQPAIFISTKIVVHRRKQESLLDKSLLQDHKPSNPKLPRTGRQ
jgi:hypothetical protein